MRLMQHMLPGLLTEPDYSGIALPGPSAPNAPQKFALPAVLAGVGALLAPVTDLINTPGNNRTAQEIARQATMQAEIAATDAAAARAANMQMIQYAGAALLIGFTIYLILR